MKIILNNTTSYIEFELADIEVQTKINKGLRETTGVKEPGYQKTARYQQGNWDGITEFYNRHTGAFPTGLLPQVLKFCQMFQEDVYPELRVSIEDNRPEEFIAPEDIPKTMTMLKEGKELTLFDHQLQAVTASLKAHAGIANQATNSGKCTLYSTNILTAENGYIPLGDIAESFGIDTTDTAERTIPVDFKIINRYGKPENVVAITVNGERSTTKVSYQSGYSTTQTSNHPLLVLDDNGDKVWRKTEDLKVGDYVVRRTTTDVFGTEHKGTALTYFTGLMSAGTDNEVPKWVMAGDKETVVSFLSGYIEANSLWTLNTEETLAITTSSEKLAHQVSLLMRQLGVHPILSTQATGKYTISLSDTASTTFLAQLNFKHTENKVQASVTEPSVYEYDKIVAIEDAGVQPTFDISTEITHSFIAEGIVNHNTAIAVAYIKSLLPYLKYGEKVMYLVPSAVIFTQAIQTMTENFGEENVGYIGDGKRNIKKINVVINASLVAGLKIPDPKAVKGKKERVQQIINREILPEFSSDANLRYRLGMFLEKYPQGKRKDSNKLAVKERLQEIYDTCQTDNKVRMALNSEQAKYTKTLRKMFSKKQKKYEGIVELIDNTPVVIADEAHHISGDGLYNALMTFDKAQYKLALTGSIDLKNPLLVQRITAFFGEIVHKTSNEEMIQKGVSAKPTVTMFELPYEDSTKPKSQFAFEKEPYLTMYTREIVQNTKRNRLIGNITKGIYDGGKTTLIIVNQIAHGDILKEMFDDLDIPSEFLSGADGSDVRADITRRVTNGELRVLIATNIFDEGADISNLNALIIASGGKSFRQVMQRIGRVLRKKKTGENVASVFDFVDRQDEILYRHSKNRKTIYKDEGYDLHVIK